VARARMCVGTGKERRVVGEVLHDDTCAALLGRDGRVRILALGDRAPDGRHEVVRRRLAEADEPLRRSAVRTGWEDEKGQRHAPIARLADADARAHEVVLEALVVFEQPAKLELGHGELGRVPA
jgi:hypothetical protein